MIFKSATARKAVQSMFEWSATCFSSVSADTNLSIHVTVSGCRYLFNCSEGTSRVMYQRGLGWKRYKAIFMTGIGAERSSGLPGLLLGMAESGVTKLDVFGSSGLDHYLASTRNSVTKPSLGIDTHEIVQRSSGPVYQDERLSVFAVPIFPNNHIMDAEALKRKRLWPKEHSPAKKRAKHEHSARRSCSPKEAIQTENEDPTPNPLELVDEEAVQWRQQVIRSMFPGDGSSVSDTGVEEMWKKRKSDIFNSSIPPYFHQPYALTYILLGAKVRGKFDVSRAEALKLEKPWMRGKLAKGISVKLSNGQVITPDMVLGPSPPQDAMMIVDCPSTDYIDSLKESDSFSNFQMGGQFSIRCIFHLIGPGVLEDPRYRQWRETFGPGVYHFVAGSDMTPDDISLTSATYAQLRLSHLDEKIFQIPKQLSCPLSSEGTVVPEDVIFLKHGHSISLKPIKPPTLPPLQDNIFHSAILKGAAKDMKSFLKPKTIAIFEKTRKALYQETSTRTTDPWRDVMINALGTGSAVPSKYRNVSSMLLQWPNAGGILLDCGEGTYGQICRQFGDRATSVLRDLRCIFISHLHADHHLGLSKLLYHRRKLNPPCGSLVTLIAHPAVGQYLTEHSDIEDLGLDDPVNGVNMLLSDDIRYNRRPLPSFNHHPTYSGLISSLGLASISTVRVKHRGFCHGIVIKHQDGWSVVYSGDTMPCDDLIDAGSNATLLVHEATMGDDEEEMALKKRHSTVGQAIDVARRMQAKNVLLTHFSSRYPKAIQIVSSQTSPAVGVAFDHVSVGINEMWKLNRCLPAIEQSFLDSEEADDDPPADLS